MARQRVGWLGLLVAGLLAFWALLAGPDVLAGVDLGKWGTALLVTVAWVSLYAISRTPLGDAERGVSPGEWKAWVGVVFMLVAVAYFLAKAHVFAQGAVWDNHGARAVGRNLVLLLVAWAVLTHVLGARWKGRVQEDERDLRIEQQAAGWGRSGLTFCLIGLAVMLAFSPAERLAWATPFMVANLLVLALMCGWLCEYAATAAMYWRDRR
ncbi:hypothetical protein ASD77_00685 [Pseudoxanthomonas sp. Root65]|uniref:hypothetical protein n=1 Tax=Pseudoxanthomonas sp. Root65 TaxID=1736576 RepID=UPI0006FD2B62|nr:hypothetical protein [Pseudoxanthomonas sp. Root65]KRA53252.1 hypothetical protein ASD77_00685 [Pseudoxanthomonas sp. Root65]